MIKKLTAATLNQDLDIPFTMENLEELSRTFTERKCPILINFDEYHPIGTVEYGSIDIDNGRLVLTVNIQDDADSVINGMFACVGYKVSEIENKGFGKYGQSGLTAISVGIVMKPDDPTIPPIKHGES